jgi:hypothetical protein
MSMRYTTYMVAVYQLDNLRFQRVLPVLEQLGGYLDS